MPLTIKFILTFFLVTLIPIGAVSGFRGKRRLNRLENRSVAGSGTVSQVRKGMDEFLT